MKSIRLLLLLTLLTAGCTSMQSTTSPEIQLRVQPATAAPGDSVVLILTNNSSARIGYNLCTSALERQSGGSWQALASDRICTMELRTLEPTQEARFTLGLPTQLQAGEYRAVTGVERMPSGERIGVASEAFRVQP